MSSLLAGFFDTEGFMPHGYCLMWRPAIFWLNLISDAVIDDTRLLTSRA